MWTGSLFPRLPQTRSSAAVPPTPTPSPAPHTLQSSLSIAERRLRDSVTPRGDFCHKIMSVSQPASSSQENHSQVNSGLLLSGLFYNSNLESIRMRAFLCQLLSEKNSSSASEHPGKPSARVLCVYITVPGPRFTYSPGFILTSLQRVSEGQIHSSTQGPCDP